MPLNQPQQQVWPRGWSGQQLCTKLGLGSLGERTERESREAGELEIAGGTGESGREEIRNGQTEESREALERPGNASLAPPQEVSRGTGRVFGTGQNPGGRAEWRRRLERRERLCPAPVLPPVFTWCLGRPTMDGKTALGASSPAKPALTSPEPLSHTSAVVSSSSHIFERRYGPEKQRGNMSGPPRTAGHRRAPPGVPSVPSRPPSRSAGTAAAAHAGGWRREREI